MKIVGARVFVREKNSDTFVFLLRDDKKDIPWPNYWETPGGRIEPGESAQQAAVREVQEEIGLEISDLRHLADYQFELIYGDKRPTRMVNNAFFLAIVESLPKSIKITEGQRAEALSLDAFLKNSVVPVYIQCATDHRDELLSGLKEYENR